MIMRDVNNGWLIRYTHANVASFFFIFVYALIYKFIINNLKQGGGAGSNTVNNFTKGHITESGRDSARVHGAHGII